MKDFLGTDVEVGDLVAAVSNPGGRRSLERARVLAINNKTITIMYLRAEEQGLNPEHYKHYLPPNCFVKITRVTLV